MSHYVKKCEHGVIVTQCRCMGPKLVIVVPCPPKCKDKDKPTPPTEKTK